MKKRLQGFVAGVVAAIVLTGIFATANDLYKKIDVIYNNIKIVIDGEKFTPKDVNGNVVEPFIYNGTTYLPVRAVAEFLDMDVSWDIENYTVSLESKPEMPEDPEKIMSDDKLVGVWNCRVDHLLSGFGVPQEIMDRYDIKMMYEYKSDGTYSVYMPETELDKLVDASFEYALLANDMKKEEYGLATGVSANETKRQIKEQIDISAFSENGEYKIVNGMLYMAVEGNSPKIMKYSIAEDASLTLYFDEVEVVFTKELK